MVFPNNFIEGEGMRFGWRAIKNIDATKAYGTAYWTEENQKETNNLKGDDARILIDRTIPFIENSHKKDKPFFSTIWFHTPHLPVVSDSPSPKLLSRVDLTKTNLLWDYFCHGRTDWQVVEKTRST